MSHVGKAFGSLPGIEHLGINAIQGVWTAYNKAEDQRILDLTQWNYTKNIMSCHAPKGVKKIEDRDKKELEKRKEDQQKILDKFYYRATGVTDFNDERFSEDDSNLDDNGEIRFAHTAEELADEMHRWVTGEADQHDRIVTEYKEGIRRRMLEERRARDRRLAQIRQEAEIAAQTFGYDTKRPKVVGYSFDEIQEMMKERGVGMTGARDIGFTPSRRERAFDRWVEENPDAGNLVSDGDRLLASRSELPRAEPQRPKRSLQEQVESRRPKLPTGGD